MSALPAFELLDRRVLAAVAFVDVRQRAVTSRIAVTAPAGVRFFWKRPGMLILTDAPGLAGHATAFDAPPAAPATGSVKLTLTARPADPGLGARAFEVALPRASDPDAADSLFAALRVVLPPTPSARLDGLAAALRVSVRRASDQAAIEGALVRLRPDGARPQTVAVTDAAGEALLIATAIPLATPGPGAQMQGDFAAELDAVVAPGAVRFNVPAQALAARAAPLAPIDPDALAAPATPAQPVRIAAGRTRTAAIEWSS